MATIKSYTNLSQSRKLAEILPVESADMCFNTHGSMPPLMTPYTRFKEFFNMEPTPSFLIPCWSLAALLEIIRNNGRYELQMYEGGYYFEANGFMTESYFNPIDACVEMILKLNELKML